MAKALNCRKRKADSCEPGGCASCQRADKGLDADLVVLDATFQASVLDEEVEKQTKIKIEPVRRLIRDLGMKSLEARWRCAIVEDAHTLTREAANAMLKCLEEPPPETLWILVTHRPEELLGTIRSRCQDVPFGPLPEETVIDLLVENGTARPAAERAAVRAEGSVGRALAVLASEQPDPAEWVADPMGAFRNADSLPRELHRARPMVEEQLDLMAWYLRRKGPEAYSDPAVRRALRDLLSLRRSLRANADPRMVLESASLRLQRTVKTS